MYTQTRSAIVFPNWLEYGLEVLMVKIWKSNTKFTWSSPPSLGYHCSRNHGRTYWNQSWMCISDFTQCWSQCASHCLHDGGLQDYANVHAMAIFRLISNCSCVLSVASSDIMSVDRYIDTMIRIQTEYMSFKSIQWCSSSYDIQEHHQHFQSRFHSQTAQYWFKVLISVMLTLQGLPQHIPQHIQWLSSPLPG